MTLKQPAQILYIDANDNYSLCPMYVMNVSTKLQNN